LLSAFGLELVAVFAFGLQLVAFLLAFVNILLAENPLFVFIFATINLQI
jgi:hypothetical protein